MISIVILNYNDKILTRNYVKKIEKFANIDNIVVVDNCSTDGSYQYLKKLESNKIKIIKSDSNDGYAFGNNIGIKYVIEHYGIKGQVVISNPDIKIKEKDFNEIIRAFDKYDDVFAVTGVVYNLKNVRIPLFTWKLPTKQILLIENSIIFRVLLRKLFKISRRYLNFDKIEKDEYYFGEALPGCFFVADIEKFCNLGLFCEETFLYCEEDILFSKAKKRGYKSIVAKNASLIHLEGVTTKKNISSWKKKENIYEQSVIVYMKKCLNCNLFDIYLYKLLNRLFLPERYIFYMLKRK